MFVRPQRYTQYVLVNVNYTFVRLQKCATWHL